MLQPTTEASFQQLVGAFTARDPMPAGGAAGVVAIAIGLGLGLKVMQISQPAGSEGGEHASRRRIQEMLQRLMPEFRLDCAAFAGLLDALRLPRDDVRRPVGVREAWHKATAAPVSVARLAREAESVLSQCDSQIKPSVRADLDAALELIGCGRRIAERNARENASRLDPATAAEVLAPLDDEQET